jgi:hypothetical protein
MRRVCQRGGFMPDIESSSIRHNPVSPDAGSPAQSGDAHVSLPAGSPSASSSGGALNGLPAMQRRPGNNEQAVNGPQGSQQAEVRPTEGSKQGRLQRLRQQWQNSSPQDPSTVSAQMLQMMQTRMQTQQQVVDAAGQLAQGIAEGIEKAAR